ncbi:MAG: type II secretion system minor pseudopilin GspK [Proteobacteria bacterium]|nr:type II secretion system minor pseudopilin GspK [Pseudomonadota bacterium]MBU4100780.1 type II secretion system minor pseudopilin GspK [Pseudomonadota bacterium]
MMGSEKGMALVLTLLIMAMITAMTVEFVYGVYTTNAGLYNWREAQKLSFAAKSGISLATKIMSENQNRYSYTYPGSIEMPVENILKGFSGKVVIRVSDENGKFNVNSLVWPNGTTNETAFDSFILLLKNLNLDENIAYWVADWIDGDLEPRRRDSEEGVKNDYLDSVDELLLVRGMDARAYDKISPLVTVYGIGQIYNNLININTASRAVIMSLDDNITEALAERVINYRALEPFNRVSDLVRVAGFEGPLGQSLMNKIVVKASNFRITSVAEEDRIKRIIECVVVVKGNAFLIAYWQET